MVWWILSRNILLFRQKDSTRCKPPDLLSCAFRFPPNRFICATQFTPESITFIIHFQNPSNYGELSNLFLVPSIGMEFGVVGGRREEHMRSFLINKNLFFCYWLRKRIGKKRALWVTSTIEKVIFIFGREVIPYKVV